MDRASTPFFFTNFSEEVGAMDLRRLFAQYGRVGEVFIPRNLNKWGRRFSFVKFKNVQNVEDGGPGKFKLKVNKARLGREEKFKL